MDKIGFTFKESKIWDMAETFLNNGWMVFFGGKEQYNLLNKFLKESPRKIENEIEDDYFKELLFTHFTDLTTFPMLSKIIFIRKSKRLQELLNISDKKIKNSFGIDVIDLTKPKIKLVNTQPQYYKKACKDLLKNIRNDFKLGNALYNY